jgi:hypothetical protein
MADTKEELTEAQRQSIKPWFEDVSAGYKKYRRRATCSARVNVALGIAILVLSTAIGSAGFATVGTTLSGTAVGALWRPILIGTLGTIVAILSALHNFFNFPEREKKSKELAVEYSDLKLDIKYFLDAPVPRTDDQVDDFLTPYEQH